MTEQARLQPLQGKVVLITGASRGIGAAAAKRLARSGATVVVNYLQNQAAAETVLQQIEAEGGRGLIYQADVTRKDQVAAMVAAIQEKFAAVDVLVNNAYFPFQIDQLHELTWENLLPAIEHELSALHHCVQA
ncbi:MAG: SDR family NAD(P)-dependent oxidoreductase, partial [Candidatus Binatia bacterium]